MLKCTASELISHFHEYFNEKIATDWFMKKAKKIYDQTSGNMRLQELTTPFEGEVDDLVFELASLADKPTHRTQAVLRHLHDEVLLALIIRWAVVTEYFQEHSKDEFPCSEHLGQFIIDYLTNHWRWIKEQADSQVYP